MAQDAPLSPAIIRTGSEYPLPQLETLHAGPLTVEYTGGDLRYIRLGSHELLRRVYVAVRDENWNTIPGQLEQLEAHTDEDSFSIRFTMVHRQDAIHFSWRGEILGTAAGEISFDMDGEVHSSFRRNRIGICVLHPAGCAGAACRVDHASGAAPTTGAFPQTISPHQPFMDMAAITHVVTTTPEGPVEAQVRFAGDIFEMEDQRNWTDASFKTYSTPLAIPYPVEVHPGERVHQRITVSILGPSAALDHLADAAPAADAPVELALASASPMPLPRLGLQVAEHGEDLSMTEISRLRALNLSHLRVDLHPQSRAFVGVLRDAWREAAFLGAQLEAALFLSGDLDRAREQLGYVARAVGEFNPDISHWLVFHRDEPSTTAQWVEAARDILSSITPEASFVVGTNAYFTELNRGRPPVAVADGITFSINPQVHAFDNLSLVETLETQGTAVESARAFAAERPVYVSPITLRPRFNPNATGPEPDPAPGTLPGSVDARQMSLFAAAWTVGSLKYLAENGATSATYYATTGWQGVLEQAHGAPANMPFPSLPGSAFPLYHVLADIGEARGGQVLPLTTSNNLAADGIALQLPGGGLRVLLANLTGAPQPVTLTGLPGDQALAHLLDESSAITAMQEPEQFRSAPGTTLTIAGGNLSITLNPYAVMRLDLPATA